MIRATVRKTGTPSRPWEVRCSECVGEHVHLHPAVGAVAVNTRGMGNRLWVLAMLAVQAHLLECHGRLACGCPSITEWEGHRCAPSRRLPEPGPGQS